MSAAPRTGTLAAEAGLLLDVVATRLGEAREHLGRPGPVAAPCPECGRSNDDCTGCPWCRLLTALRAQRPEVTVALIDALAGAVAAIRLVLPGRPSPTR